MVVKPCKRNIGIDNVLPFDVLPVRIVGIVALALPRMNADGNCNVRDFSVCV